MPARSKPRIAIIGAGFSGMCAAIQLQKQLGEAGSNLTIFDENEDFGGTWLVNKYPGCACDVQSHLYSLSFEPNPNWSKNYSSQPEIWAYMLGIAKKYDLYRKARFSTQVKSLEWLEADGQWKIEIFNKNTEETEDLRFEYVICAVGGLRMPLVPEEFLSFKGQIIHSAEWDPAIDLSGKRVGVIGSGASAIQIIPNIAGKVKELHSYQRKPAWVVPRTQFEVPELIRNLFTAIPIFMWLFRTLIFLANEAHFSAFKQDTYLNHLGKWLVNRHMRKQMPGNEELVKKLTPDFNIGCKRILVANDYFPAFTRSNVHLYREKIEKVEGNTIKVAGKAPQELDVLILATGFRVQDFFTPLQVNAKNNVDLLTKWKNEGPTSYYGIMSNDVPNAFFILGPNTALGHNSVVFMIECQVNFLIQVIRETERKGAKSVVIKKTAEDKFMTMVSRDMKTTIWETCQSWYKDHRGIITALWPKNCISYWRETRSVDFSNVQWSF